ncbi:MAG: hypothetical protein JSS45_09005 [Proteobacteria bacterium]|nr:hypothetical protein [Pseudomonadota bacterium]
MANTRIIHCVGASDEDTAHLRLLLRSAIIHLIDAWRWGPEDRADLVVADVRSLVGDSALRRSQQRGVVCATIVEAADPAPAGKFLRKPLRRDDFVALLNTVGSSTVAPLALVSQGEDFFDLDLGEAAFDASELPSIEVSLARDDRERAQDAFDSIFHRDPEAEKSVFLMPEKLDADAGVEFVRDTTARSESRADAYGNPFVRGGVDDANVDPTFLRGIERVFDDDQAQPLAAYLQPGRLGGPAIIEWPGAAVLVLDPKARVFHCEGRLPSLERYFRQPIRAGDWTRLVSSELATWRARAPARPYQRLIWMDRFIGSNGYLAAHLDPGGLYRLTRWLELAQDYPRAFRIGANMIVPQRLGDIAHVSEVSLAEVFDVVNAYEAIGYVEWSRRQRSRPEDAA